jgi:N-acetylglucosaminyl-diphospho-decaprenol L-rhamnosyltransferase
MSEGGQVPLVSVAVVTHNNEAILPAYFDALRETTYPRIEVIAVDNGSSDGTMAYLREHADRVIINDPSPGYGSACNQAAAIAAGEHFVFCNPDIIVTPNWLDVLVGIVTDDPSIGIVSPEIIPPGWRPRNAPGRVMEIAAVAGAAVLLPRRVWVELGGFDETVFLYWEDTDLCWRAWLAGHRVVESLDCYVVHDEGGSGGGSRFAAEEIKNGLYIHLKLQRWRRVPSFVLLLATKTVIRAVQGRRIDVFGGWWWNLRHLPVTLERRRRALAGTPAERRIDLERRIAGHRRRRWGERILERVRPRLER